MQAYVIPDIKIVRPQGIVEGNILVESGKIKRIGRSASLPKLHRLKFPKGSLAFPGLIDAHVHLRDMELSYKEDFVTGTRAGAKGGYTTLLDMPNTRPPTNSAIRMKEKIARATGRLAVNVGFFGVLVENPLQLSEMAQAGALGFKLYMSKPISPIPIDDDESLTSILASAAKTDLPVAVHAEDRALINTVQSAIEAGDRSSISDFLTAHSNEAELKAVQRVLRIAHSAGSRIHICHVSLPQTAEIVADQRRSGLQCTCEVTPHHLLLSTSDLRKKHGFALMVPPLRTRSGQMKLWRQLVEREIDIVASDHAPHTLEEKSKPRIWDISPGIPGLETTLPLMLTEFKRRGIGYEKLAGMLSSRPAQIFGLSGKGYLDKDFDADITIVDPKATGVIDSKQFETKAKFSPFDGMKIQGKPITTIVAGHVVMEGGEVSEERAGKVLLGPRATP
jgi:dihydroorotase